MLFYFLASKKAIYKFVSLSQFCAICVLLGGNSHLSRTGKTNFSHLEQENYSWALPNFPSKGRQVYPPSGSHWWQTLWSWGARALFPFKLSNSRHVLWNLFPSVMSDMPYPGIRFFFPRDQNGTFLCETLFCPKSSHIIRNFTFLVFKIEPNSRDCRWNSRISTLGTIFLFGY